MDGLGALGTVFGTVGLGHKGRAANGTALALGPVENLRFQRRIHRQDEPAQPFAVD